MYLLSIQWDGMESLHRAPMLHTTAGDQPYFEEKLELGAEKPSFIRKYHVYLKKPLMRGWLAQSVEHAILDLRVVNSSPTLGLEFT